MAFRVGQKVVCVDNGEWPADAFGNVGSWRGDIPVEGKVYTVARTGLTYRHCECIELVEIRNNARPGNFPGYRAARFRPAVDISDLESIVTEVFKTKRRTVNIPADKFDKVHSARALGRSAAIPRAAGADGSPASAPPICPDAIPPSRVDRELAAEALR